MAAVAVAIVAVGEPFSRLLRQTQGVPVAIVAVQEPNWATAWEILQKS